MKLNGPGKYEGEPSVLVGMILLAIAILAVMVIVVSSAAHMA